MPAAFLQPESTHIIPTFLRDQPPSGRGAAPESTIETEQQIQEQVPDWKEKLLCRACRQVITSPSEKTDVQGSHEHTFANPGGTIYQIGCFRSACGCAYFGAPTDEFTWFKGYQWRVACCSTCDAHLGWLFVSTGLSSFHGFILNRLVSEQGQEQVR